MHTANTPLASTPPLAFKASPAGMVALPPEIWSMVLAPMDRRDILNVALASRALSDPARRILVESVTLDGGKDRPYQEYIENLRKHDLLRLIKKLEVKMVPLGAIPWSEIPNVLSLSLGPVCMDHWIGWTSRLHNSLMHLASFKLEEIIIQAEYSMPDSKLAIPNIKRIIWNDGEEVSLPFFSLCKASLQTITELTVVVTDDPSETNIYTKLWKLRFPNLHLLNIGPGNAAFRTQNFSAVEKAFTQFLHAHSAIDNLTLGTLYEPENEDYEDVYLPREAEDVYLPLHFRAVSRAADTILPNLTFLRAHPQQIQTFVDANARFLGTLQTLALPEDPFCDMEDSIGDILESFEQYEECNGIPFSVLEKCFSQFRCLKKLHCMSERTTVTIDDVRKLAEKCLFLETYRCIKSGRDFEITREGTVGQVFIRVNQRRRGER